MARPLSPSSQERFFTCNIEEFDFIGRCYLHIMRGGEFVIDDNLNLKIINREFLEASLRQEVLKDAGEIKMTEEEVVREINKVLGFF